MKILLDTSILVAAMVEAHPAHAKAIPWLKRVTDRSDTGLVAAHSLAELYAILTTLPVQPSISPKEARELIFHNIINKFDVVFLSDHEYLDVIEHMCSLGIVGGAVYDALILRAALKANVDRVITLNGKDFCRVYPDLANKIITP